MDKTYTIIGKITPIFKVGDIIFHSPDLPNNKSYTISKVDILNQCYRFEETGCTLPFTKQHCAKGIKADNSRPPVEEETNPDNLAICGSYLDIRVIKMIQAKSVANKIGMNIIDNIIEHIRLAADEGKSDIKINYKDYEINNDKLPFVIHWARICGFGVVSYENCMYINWN